MNIFTFENIKNKIGIILNINCTLLKVIKILENNNNNKVLFRYFSFTLLLLEILSKTFDQIKKVIKFPGMSFPKSLYL